MVDLVLHKLPEIEHINGIDGMLYQIYFHQLTSQSDMAERVLYEAGATLSIDELMFAIKGRLQQVGIQRELDGSSLRGQMLTQKKHIKTHGKKGLYTWTDPNASRPLKTYSILGLIKKVLAESNKPLKITPINEYINVYLAGIGATATHGAKETASSLSYMLGQKNGVLRLVDGSYILTEMSVQYQELIEKTGQVTKAPKGALLKKVVTLLDVQPDKKMIRRELVKKLLIDKHPRPSIQAVLSRTDYFEQIKVENDSWISLKEGSPNLKISKRQQLIDCAVKLLSSISERQLPMNVVVNHIQKELTLSDGQKQGIYKVITENPKLFFKQKGDEKYVVLLSSPVEIKIELSQEYGHSANWSMLQQVLVDEVNDIMAQVSQHTSYDLLGLFRQVATSSHNHRDLEGLAQLPRHLWEYYTDKKSEYHKQVYAKEIIRLMEPFAQKVLSIVYPGAHDEYVHAYKKGLVELTKLLPAVKIYKYPVIKPVLDLAKSARNKVAHSARVWDVDKQHERVNACLIEMLYVVDSYYTELKLLCP